MKTSGELPGRESVWSLGCGVALVAVLALFVALIATYYVPSYGSGTANGYLVTAKRLATTGSPVRHTSSPYEFVNGHWVDVRPNDFCAKFAIGYTALCAVAYKLGGPSAVYLVSPILAALAVVGIFLLGREMFNDFSGALAAVLLATNPVHGYHALDATSHAGSVCFAVWSMFFVWRWSQRGGRLNAVCGGALAGYALAVRHTEGLLALPILGMIAWRWVAQVRDAPAEQRRHASTRVASDGALIAAAAIAGAVPLFLHQWIAFGSPLTTGYELCGESTAFAWHWFREHWWLALRKLTTAGLLWVFPLGLVGLGWLAARDAKRALFLGLWAVPGILLYTAYYWLPKQDNLAYIRFFLSFFPPLILAAVVLLGAPGRRKSWWSAVQGLLVLLLAGMNLSASTRRLDQRMSELQFTKTTGEAVSAHLPAGAGLMATPRVLSYLEFVVDNQLFSIRIFERDFIQGIANAAKRGGPSILIRQRLEQQVRLLGDKTDQQLAELQGELITETLARGGRFMLAATDDEARHVRNRLAKKLRLQMVSTWVETQAGPGDKVRCTPWALYEFKLAANPESK